MFDSILWQPHKGPQTWGLQRSEYELCFGGMRGGGKTDLGLVKMLYGVHNTNYKGLVIRRNSVDLSDWVSRARNMYSPLQAKFSGNPPTIRFPSGAFIKTGHLQDEKAYTHYQGMEFHRILIEELTQIPREQDYLALIGSCRSTIPELKPQILSTCNPGGAGHSWVKQRFYDVAYKKAYTDPISGRTRIFIPSSIEDNPTLMKNDPNYVKYLETLPEDLKRAWRYGDWEVFSGQFFGKLRREKHICKPFKIPEHWVRYRSLDWGFNHDTACVWWAISPDRKAYIYRYYLKNNVPVSKAVQEILKIGKRDENLVQTTITDPAVWVRNPYSEARATTMADTMIDNGLMVQKANNDRVNGWKALRELLEWDEYDDPRLQIFESCEPIFNGLTTLIHDEKKPEDVMKTIGDDVGDCVRYGAMHLYAGLPLEVQKNSYEKLIEELTDLNEKTEQWDSN